MISTPGGKVDPIAEILKTRYGLVSGRSWHSLLGQEYVHAVGLLKQAEVAFDAGRSYWLTNQNSFNQVIFLGLQRHLHAIGHAGACTTIDKRGQLVDFGVALDPNGPFSRTCPVIADCFRTMNARRNRLPGTHPYEKKTVARSEHLKAQERNQLVSRMRTAYRDLASLMP